MSGSNIQQNLVPNEPTLKDVFDLAKKDILLSLNCHHIGTVQAFDEINQLANVTINYLKTYFLPDPVTGVYGPVTRSYPVIIDAPVICLGGGNGALTFPIVKGDECLVLFNDRDLDNWFNGSSSSPTATPRLHAITDALVLVGVRSLANTLDDYDTDAVALRTTDGSNSVKVFSDKVTQTVGDAFSLEINSGGKLKATNAPGVELIDILVKLFTDLQSGTAGGNPLVLPPDYALQLTNLTTFKA